MTEEPGKVLYDHSNKILEWTSLHCAEDPLCLSSEKLILKGNFRMYNRYSTGTYCTSS